MGCNSEIGPIEPSQRMVPEPAQRCARSEPRVTSANKVNPSSIRADDPVTICASQPTRIWLASRSVRRRQLLQEAGIEARAAHPGLEDGGLCSGKVDPRRWVVALAYLKAVTALRTGAFGAQDFSSADLVIGADTAIVKAGQLIGTPECAQSARTILHTLRDGQHTVVSGVAMIQPSTNRRELFWDEATVHFGSLSDSDIDAYVLTAAWRGKAGGYNLQERIADRWPITHSGEASTIMGLPMPKLRQRLTAWSRLVSL